MEALVTFLGLVLLAYYFRIWIRKNLTQKENQIAYSEYMRSKILESEEYKSELINSKNLINSLDSKLKDSESKQREIITHHTTNNYETKKEIVNNHYHYHFTTQNKEQVFTKRQEKEINPLKQIGEGNE